MAKTIMYVGREERISIPSSLFLDRTLSVLENIAEYLKEEKLMTYHQIAEALNRDDRTVWTCYQRAKKKRAGKISILLRAKEVMIPVDIFKDRTLSVLEIIAEYLKDKKQMTYREIGRLLNRNERTIWTCYQRAKKKRELIEKLKL